MDDAALVRGFERLRDLRSRSSSASATGSRPAAIRSASVSPSTSSSTNAGRPSTGFHAVDGADVRMIQRSQQPRFPLEAREPIRIAGGRPRQDLDGDLATEPFVVGTIDLAHAAGVQERPNQICPEPAADEGLLAGHARRRESRRLQECARPSFVGQERLDFVPERLVTPAQLSQNAGPLRGWTSDDRVVDVFDLSPAFRCHPWLGRILLVRAGTFALCRRRFPARFSAG